MWQQWLAYYNSWLGWPSGKGYHKPALVPFERLKSRAKIRQANVTWNEAEEKGKVAYLALRRNRRGS